MERRDVLKLMAAPIAAAFLSDPVRSSEGAPLTVDSHVHVWKHDPRFPFAAGRKVPDEDASAEMLLDLMAANNVARTVLIQVIHYKWDNTYLADVLKRHPGKFLGVCRVDPEDPAAPDTLSRLVTEQGFHGVRISPYAAPEYDWIKGPLMPQLWRRCRELNVPMTVLTEAPRLPQLVPLIEANPDLTVVIDHMADIGPGKPADLALLLALARYPRVFVKISHLWSLSRAPYPYADMTDQLKRLVAAFGPKRLMWGTDWPVSAPYRSYGDIVALYRDHLNFLSPADRAQILGRTVQNVWPFGLR